ncbi:hypothetical protein IV203_015088 [Nitzschia inconspicua]|uniref:Uncharacterized protein n=1 Tax=Nitzschia inconspicua TaxID=303405 RepID=A0A9K3PVB7_9STRA|nr:hypothetical protein IV203_015088 [Nitzschia inconspicua]
MDLRTTSISESMHWSMKSGFDGVRAGMDTVTAANTMMDKSDRRLEAIQKENAMQERRSQKFSSLPTAGHLTEFCQKEVERQWGRRGLYVVVQANVDQGEWWVFQPHEDSGGISAPPRYTRLRRVKLVSKTCRCVCLGFDGTRNSNESWLSIEEEQDPRVIEAKHLYELTWVQKRVAVKGIPLPGTNVAAEEQDAVFEVECHVPDTIQELQRSQQVAVTPLKKKSTKKAMWMEKIRQAMDMAAGKDDEEFMESCVNHMHSGMTGRVTTRRGERKRSSEYVFPETGKSKQRVEKRKNNVGQF